MRLWDAATGEEKNTLTAGSDNFFSVAFRRMGPRWQPAVRTRRCGCGTWPRGRIYAPSQDIPIRSSSVAFSPDGTTLASGSYDCTILLWDVSSRAALQPLAADFDGDGAVGFSDFLQFIAKYGLSWGDAGYDARFDLDGDGDRRVPRLVDLRKKLRPGYLRRTNSVGNRSRQICIKSGNPPPSGGFPAWELTP